MVILTEVEDEQITLQTTQDLYVQIAGSQVFTKLDFSEAFAQLKGDEASTKFLIINAHKGLNAYLKLPYGVKSSQKIIFQSNIIGHTQMC